MKNGKQKLGLRKKYARIKWSFAYIRVSNHIKSLSKLLLAISTS